MIGKLSYDQVEAIIKDLRLQADIIHKLLNGRSVPDIPDFVEKVDGYSKFLENSLELNRDADAAIVDIPK